MESENKLDKQSLVYFYHPDEANSVKYKSLFEEVACLAKTEKAGINVLGLNMSKERDVKHWKITNYPTFRLFTAPKKFDDYKGEYLTVETMKTWLHEKDVKIPKGKEEEKKSDNKHTKEEKKDEKKEEKKEEKKVEKKDEKKVEKKDEKKEDKKEDKIYWLSKHKGRLD